MCGGGGNNVQSSDKSPVAEFIVTAIGTLYRDGKLIVGVCLMRKSYGCRHFRRACGFAVFETSRSIVGNGRRFRKRRRKFKNGFADRLVVD